MTRNRQQRRKSWTGIAAIVLIVTVLTPALSDNTDAANTQVTVTSPCDVLNSVPCTDFVVQHCKAKGTTCKDVLRGASAFAYGRNGTLLTLEYDKHTCLTMDFKDLDDRIDVVKNDVPFEDVKGSFTLCDNDRAFVVDRRQPQGRA